MTGTLIYEPPIAPKVRFMTLCTFTSMVFGLGRLSSTDVHDTSSLRTESHMHTPAYNARSHSRPKTPSFPKTGIEQGRPLKARGVVHAKHAHAARVWLTCKFNMCPRHVCVCVAFARGHTIAHNLFMHMHIFWPA